MEQMERGGGGGGEGGGCNKTKTKHLGEKKRWMQIYVVDSIEVVKHTEKCNREYDGEKINVSALVVLYFLAHCAISCL
jgi:hypothetical protein